MRSRYSAFALGDADHLFRTWDPRTRPDDVAVDPDVTWTGLDIVSTTDGGPSDEAGEVRFVAHLRTTDGPGRLEEHSRFRRHGGRWVYVDGDHPG